MAKLLLYRSLILYRYSILCCWEVVEVHPDAQLRKQLFDKFLLQKLAPVHCSLLGLRIGIGTTKSRWQGFRYLPCPLHRAAFDSADSV